MKFSCARCFIATFKASEVESYCDADDVDLCFISCKFLFSRLHSALNDFPQFVSYDGALKFEVPEFRNKTIEKKR